MIVSSTWSIRKLSLRKLCACASSSGALWLWAANVSAETIEVYLCAGAVSQSMPDGRQVSMWGYARVADASALAPGCSQAATVPGPVLRLPPAAASTTPTTLQVHLYNDGLPEGVSIVVPGQTVALQPVRNPDGRVRSFTTETAAGTATVYTWPNFEPGTYAYHSGSHPAVQVQMGLYGAITQDVAANEAYPGVAYAQDVVLVYSEVDPALHDAVSSGSYGAPPFTSTIEYRPRYYLVNGQAPSGSSTPPLPAGTAGERTLLRLLNLGLETHVPLILGGHVALVAEDGNPYPAAREQYSVLLPAAKTSDALWVPEDPGVFALFDRRLRLQNAPGVFGGMFSQLEVAAAPAPAPPSGSPPAGPSTEVP